MMKKIKTYSECIRLPTWAERIQYLSTKSSVGRETFGYDRYINQDFYKSAAWINFRHSIIVRDNGCDLAVDGYDIHDVILVHHIQEITMDDIINGNPIVMDPENVICTRHRTHNLIHFGVGEVKDPNKIVVRKPNDHIPWRRS